MFCLYEGEAEQELGKVAVTTVHKMISNLHNNPSDLKLRSIRVGNKAFQSKVAAVPGGAELLLAAGYAYSTSTSNGSMSNNNYSNENTSIPAPAPQEGSADADTSTATTTSPPAAPQAQGGITNQGLSQGEELFLVHPMDAPGRRRLHYTLNRSITSSLNQSINQSMPVYLLWTNSYVCMYMYLYIIVHILVIVITG